MCHIIHRSTTNHRYKFQICMPMNFQAIDGIALGGLCDYSFIAMYQKGNERVVQDIPFPHEDNNLSHLLFSSAFHCNDTLLSSCMLIITSRGGLFRWFTSSVKNLICSLSISFSYQIATLLSSSPLLNAWEIARKRSNMTHIVSNGNAQRSLRAR